MKTYIVVPQYGGTQHDYMSDMINHTVQRMNVQDNKAAILCVAEKMYGFKIVSEYLKIVEQQ